METSQGGNKQDGQVLQSFIAISGDISPEFRKQGTPYWTVNCHFLLCNQ